MLGIRRFGSVDGGSRLGLCFGLEGVAALFAQLAQVLLVEREEAALREAVLVAPADVLAVCVGAQEGAAEDDLAAGAAAVALALAPGEERLCLLGRPRLSFDETPDLAARLQGHPRPVGHTRS